MKTKIKKQAKILRKKGYSFREISEICNISKSTASLWCRKEALNSKAKQRIKKLGDLGRKKGEKISKEKRFLELQLINENKFRAWVHLHKYHNEKEMVSFWSSITSIDKSKFFIYNKPHTGINRKPGYKGCISIRYNDSIIFKEVFIIINRFVKYINNAGLV